MTTRTPSVAWGYALLVGAFLGIAALNFPDAPATHPRLAFVRAPSQPLLGLVPGGLPHLDRAAVRASVARMRPVRLLRQAGNSLRIASGQVLEWVVWGGREPLMLFASTELWVSAGLDPALERALTALAERMARYHATLAAEGWSLVVVPVPTKLGIHRELASWPIGDSDPLSRAEVPFDRSDEVYGFFIAALRARAVAAVDLQSIYRAEIARRPSVLLYPQGDSHWSGEGLRIAADATADEIARRTAMRTRPLREPSYAEIRHSADLATAFDPLPALTTRLAPAYLVHERIATREGGRAYAVPAQPQMLVMAVGSSYTFYYTGHTQDPVAFPWQLGLRMSQAEVRQQAFAGSVGAFHDFWPQRERLARDFGARAGTGAPKVVVWEFPMRDALAVGALPLLR